LYVQHPDWTNKAKKAMGKYTSEPSFSWTGKGQRSPMASGPKNVPGPGLYKVRPVDCVNERSINQPRLIKGKFSTAPKKFCFAVSDNAIPGPGKYTVPFYKTEENLHKGAPLMAESAKQTSSRELIKKVAPGPGEYKPSHTLLEKREAGGTWGRREVLQKVVAKRYTDIVANSKKNVPDPGKYPLIKLDKISRGAKWSQVHGVARSAIHGTY
jgi:hypothetical protein